MFSFGNFSLSVLGHAAIALALIGIAATRPARKIIAPDRIKIVEINLKDVKIEGLETKLKNQEKSADKKTKPKAKNKDETAKPDNKAPVVQTVKVNRKVHAVDRTLTVSVIDALRVAMTRCWQIDSTRPDLAEMRAVVHIRLFPNGRVQSHWFEQASRADTDPSFAYVLETIRLAISACNPFSMLPRGEYDKWKSVQLSFFPTAKVVE